MSSPTAPTVRIQDDAAPATPQVALNGVVARAEGVGFPGVGGGDAVALQGTTAGVPVQAMAAPDGSRYADVDAHSDVAPAAPRGTYPLDFARAAGAPSAAVTAGDAVVPTSSLNGIPYCAQTDEALTAVADVDVEDSPAPANPAGTYGVGVALDEAGAGAGVIAGDAVAPRYSLDGVPYFAQTDRTMSRVADIDAENEAAPAAPRGGYSGGRTTTASPAFTNGDYTPMNFDLSGRLRTAPSAPAAGKDAIHVAFNDPTLAAGASDVTFRTVTAARFSELVSCMAAYTGTVAGVTLQLLAGGVPVAPPVGSLTSGQRVELIEPGVRIPADAAEVYAVRIAGATLNDDLDVEAHLVEETT